MESTSLIMYLVYLENMHRPPSEARTYFKILCYVFKYLHNPAPKYLTELMTVQRDHDLTLVVPRCHSKMGERAFSVAGPMLWNSLPNNIRHISQLDTPTI